MPLFNYKARRRSGEVVEGSLDVLDRSAAVLAVQKLGLFPISVAASKGHASASKPGSNADPKAAGRSVLPPTLRAFLNRRRKPKIQELATFTLQLANLLHAGMPLTMALNSMASLTAKGIPPEVARQLRQDVMEGRSLSDALAKQPDIFPPIVVNMVRAGEQSGALEEVLRRQAAHFERFAEVQSKFKSAMIYPMVVCAVGVALVFFFMTVMLPKFTTLFESIPNLELPASTKFLISASHFMTTWWWLFPIVAALIVTIYKRYHASSQGRRMIDRLQMKAPVVGGVIRLNLFGQFSRTLGTLLRNGVPVLQALKITEQIIPNVIVAEAISKTREGVTDGKTLAQPLAKSGLFPQLMIDLLKIGEETGDIPLALENVAETYERELNLGLRTLTNLIEPMMIVGIAIAVGFLLMSVMSAMFAITSSIQR
jgi:type II secretory pathway component PulF